METIGHEHVQTLDQALAAHQSALERLRGFILPGGTRAAAAADLGRAVCRRAERRMVTLAQADQSAGSPHLVAYLNRLSNVLFVVARVLNAREGRPETPWNRAGAGEDAQP